MNIRRYLFVGLVGCIAHCSAVAQTLLPRFEKEVQTVHDDWLLGTDRAKAEVYQDADGYLVFSNGLVSRTFTVTPNVATVALDELDSNTSFVRSVRPEAQLVLDGICCNVGGLLGQPVHNYLLKEWIPQLYADSLSFRFVSYRVEAVKERFPWKKRLEWMPKDMPWPVPGKELIFTYQLDPAAVTALAALQGKAGRYDRLAGVEVEVHYELYDNMPVFCKWMTVVNRSNEEVTVNSFKSELLAAVEPESTVDQRRQWNYPNITIDTDYNFGGMSEDYIYSSSVAWLPDTLYRSQVNVELETPCLLEVAPKVGPDQRLKPGEEFISFRVWELLNDSWDRERKSLAYRRIVRSIAPCVTENPILMHVRTSDDMAVKKAIDQCAAVGFEMVIMTFGSGFDAEDESPANMERMKRLAAYAKLRHIALGGYSLLASRHIDAENDVVLPEGQKPRFGYSPCVESRWGQEYMRKLRHLYHTTGLSVLEHDGSYPGDVCYSVAHPGHRGVDDSQWMQFQRISDFYKWCRGRGIYLNVPDLYFLNGSNKVGMGYREVNWSLPRAQQEIIERQNIFDGTWNKTPSMGWMFVPLVEYQGGGEAATIEPLKDHLPHYGQRLANLFGAGVQACYRGPQLYDSPQTKELVRRWVDFYKRHREVLDGDIIHVRRPDGRDYDAWLHVNPTGAEKGLLMVYNPLNESIHRTVKVNLYYTGLRGSAVVSEQEGAPRTLTVDRYGNAFFDVSIPPRSQTWFVIKE